MQNKKTIPNFINRNSLFPLLLTYQNDLIYKNNNLLHIKEKEFLWLSPSTSRIGL